MPSPDVGYMNAKCISQAKCLKPSNLVHKVELRNSESRESSAGPLNTQEVPPLAQRP